MFANRRGLATSILLSAAVIVLSSCITSKEVTLTVTAQFLADKQPVKCPPICMEVDNPKSGPDTVRPLAFKVCSPTAGCQDVNPGDTAKVRSDATVDPPDGISRGEQLAALEKDVYLRFQEWSDGVKTVPRQVGAAADTLNLVAYYAAWKPVTVATTASGRGCGTDVGIFLETSSQ